MKRHLAILLMFVSGTVVAQERLTLQDAIARTLKRNFDINIAIVSTQQAARNNTLGNAGFSPNVALNLNASESLSNVESDLSNGSSQNNPNAKSVNYNPNLQVSWTIFDGGRMFIVKKQLDKLEALSQVQLQAQMQIMVSRTIQTYAQVVWQQQQLVAIDTALALAKARMQISYAKFETGASAKVDYLQARVDYNARRSDSLSYVATLQQASDSLSVLMGEQAERTYLVDDSLPLNTQLQPVDKERLAAVNLALSTYRYNAELSHMNADVAKTYFLPSLFFNGGYNYSRTTNATGFTLYSQSYGPSGTLTLSVPVFQGGNLRRQATLTSLQAMKDDLIYEKQNTLLGRQYRTAWRNYTVAIASYKIATESIGYAKENLDVQKARFRLGAGTTLEIRQAENDYVAALGTLFTAAYNVKVNETILLELENQLVKK